MKEYSSERNGFEPIITYLDYKGVNLDKINFKNMTVLDRVGFKESEAALIARMGTLESLTLDEIRSLAKSFLEKYFSVHDVSTVTIEELKKNNEFISCSKNSGEFYEKVNGLLTSTSPFNLPIKVVEGHQMNGRLIKPILCCPVCLTDPVRKIYFEGIEIGEGLNKISAATVVHELTHTQLESNFGYAEDYLNKEVITILLEKIAALEFDESKEILQIFEKERFLDTLKHYRNLCLYMAMGYKPDVDDLLYVKSTLYAIKIFDEYLKETKQKNRDKYFSDIQDVFDGKNTVEDFIRKRGIRTNQCLDLGLLQRHI